MIKKFLDLDVYKIAHKLAMNIFDVTKNFPDDEKFSLTDQIRRSSISIAVNMAEGWGKRKYVQQFKKHIIDAIGSLEETKSWLLFCFNCNYISQKIL